MSEKGTEEASPLRRKKARDDGDIVRSRELISAVAMLGGVLTLGGLSNAFVREFLRSYMASLKAFTIEDIAGQQGIDVIRGMMLPVALPIAAVMAATFTGALVTGIAQGGGVGFHPKSLGFKFDRINPVTNVSNLFSLRSASRLAKSLVPAAVMVVFGWTALKVLMTTMPVMGMTRLPETFTTAYHLALDAAWVTLAWSGLDYAIEYRSWTQKLKMTKQEVREEMRDATGNPQIKARVRQIQRAMRRRRARADISRASVLITNPTHYAVALEFSFETMMAPVVLAKGRGPAGGGVARRGAMGGDTDRRKPAAGAQFVSVGRTGAGDPVRAVPGCRGHPRISLSAEGGREDAGGADGEGRNASARKMAGA